ncbi:hypothetical protein [uncultured Porphyromonas sp.]|uniref:hypothetical protein n=1 Tax=uncultured Porphyromonas sp. TaxID=159274 RepID=UPI002621E542|nr:hypothetical protein [uncultured Porphyromonas sp.]
MSAGSNPPEELVLQPLEIGDTKASELGARIIVDKAKANKQRTIPATLIALLLALRTPKQADLLPLR